MGLVVGAFVVALVDVWMLNIFQFLVEKTLGGLKTVRTLSGGAEG